MNVCLFFEGTGHGVEGRVTNVTRLYDLCADDGGQKLHLEAGPGTHFGSYVSGKIAGTDWRIIFRSARRWFESNYETLPDDGFSTKVFLFGFSRGALLARRFAAWLEKLSIEVEYLGLWDTVDSTIGLDVPERCPGNVLKARHAVARDEERKFFAYIPLRGEESSVEEMIFPGSHSDIGGLFEDNHEMADLTLAWIASGAEDAGLRLKEGVQLSEHLDTSSVVLHDSYTEANNLWGAFEKVRRNLSGLPLHRLCMKLRLKEPGD